MPLVVLVGAPGAGKTTAGELLAEQLGREFIDTDRLVEQSAGKSVSDIFIEDGEAEFRRVEVRAVADALAAPDAVVALGGGAVLDAETRKRLAGHRVVWLEVGFADAVQRVGMNRDRPLLLANPRAQLLALLQERRPHYAAVAAMTVQTDGRTVDDIVGEIVEALGNGNGFDAAEGTER